MDTTGYKNMFSKDIQCFHHNSHHSMQTQHNQCSQLLRFYEILQKNISNRQTSISHMLEIFHSFFNVKLHACAKIDVEIFCKIS